MTVGYAGAEGKSDTKNMDRAVTYQSVCSGDGNTEALKVRFDTTKVTIEELLDVFFASHDATRRTASAQYESAVWPQSEAQYEKVRAYVEAMNENAMMKQRRPIATKIRNPSKTRFAIAERYHQNYNKKNAYRLCGVWRVFIELASSGLVLLARAVEKFSSAREWFYPRWNKCYRFTIECWTS